MAHSYARAFYTSAAWAKTRSAYIAYRRSIDGGICEICHERLGEIVHHKTMITPANISDPNVTLSFANLQLVCWQCHNALPGHAWGHNEALAKQRSRRVMFGENGDPIGIRETDEEKFVKGIPPFHKDS